MTLRGLHRGNRFPWPKTYQRKSFSFPPIVSLTTAFPWNREFREDEGISKTCMYLIYINAGKPTPARNLRRSTEFCKLLMKGSRSGPAGSSSIFANTKNGELFRGNVATEFPLANTLVGMSIVGYTKKHQKTGETLVYQIIFSF